MIVQSAVTAHQASNPLGNRLYRYELVNDKLVNPKLLLDLPFNYHHNGGKIIVGPDNNVYFTIGDANYRDRPKTSRIKPTLMGQVEYIESLKMARQ